MLASFFFPNAEQQHGIQKDTEVLPIDDKIQQDDSDSSSSDDSSSSSSLSEILPLENNSFILNCFTKVAHVAKFVKDNPYPSPACGRDLGISVGLLQVVDHLPSDYDL